MDLMDQIQYIWGDFFILLLWTVNQSESSHFLIAGCRGESFNECILFSKLIILNFNVFLATPSIPSNTPVGTTSSRSHALGGSSVFMYV